MDFTSKATTNGKSHKFIVLEKPISRLKTHPVMGTYLLTQEEKQELEAIIASRIMLIGEKQGEIAALQNQIKDLKAHVDSATADNNRDARVATTGRDERKQDCYRLLNFEKGKCQYFTKHDKRIIREHDMTDQHMQMVITDLGDLREIKDDDAYLYEDTLYFEGKTYAFGDQVMELEEDDEDDSSPEAADASPETKEVDYDSTPQSEAAKHLQASGRSIRVEHPTLEFTTTDPFTGLEIVYYFSDPNDSDQGKWPCVNPSTAQLMVPMTQKEPLYTLFLNIASANDKWGAESGYTVMGSDDMRNMPGKILAQDCEYATPAEAITAQTAYLTDLLKNLHKPEKAYNHAQKFLQQCVAQLKQQ